MNEQLFRDWQALREACRDYHAKQMKKSRGGGSVVCICGAGCGGSAACGMLGLLRNLIRQIPSDAVYDNCSKLLEDLKDIV